MPAKDIPEVLDGEVVYIADAIKDERIQHPQIAKAQRISSILAAPIMAKGRSDWRDQALHTRPSYIFVRMTRISLSLLPILVLCWWKEMSFTAYWGSGHKGVKEQSKLAQLPTTSLRPAEFAHPSEEEFVRLLDFYQIEWLYEPRAFPLRWENGGIVEMFTPDFYLPEFDFYIELTTLRQDLVTEKNRKVRRLKELYPEISIKLLNKNDFLRLLGKYGYGSLGEAKLQGIDRILLTHSQIQRRVKALAKANLS